MHIKAGKQIGQWECDTFIGASHKGAAVTKVERKSGYAVVAKAPNKTIVLDSLAKISNQKPLSIWLKKLPYDIGKEFVWHSLIDQELNSTAYFAKSIVN